MAYVPGTNYDPRFTLPTFQPNNARFASQLSQQMNDEDDAWSKQTYINHVYGGPVSNQPEVYQAIAKQYDYNKMRVLSGKDPLKIADVRWNPTSYDDLINEWMAHRYQETGKLPSGEEQLDRYQEDAAKKWRETFETAAEPAGYQPIAGGLSALKDSVGTPTQQQTISADDTSTTSDAGKNTVSIGNLLNISDADLDNPDIARYVLNTRNSNTEASFPDWGVAAAKRMIQLFDPTWTPERQISDMSPEQRKQEALEYLNQIRVYANSPDYQMKATLPQDVDKSLKAFGSGLIDTLSGGMLDNEYFREAGQADPSARILGELAGQLVPAGKIDREFTIRKGPTLKNARKLALEDAQAELASVTRSDSVPAVADDIINAYTEHAQDVLKNANFAQKTYKPTFSNEGQLIYSELAGVPVNTTDDLVNALKKRLIKSSDVPIDYIERDGNILILNTRSSHALMQAGIPRSEWNAINRTGIDMYENMLNNQLKNNGLTSAGTPTARMTGGH